MKIGIIGDVHWSTYSSIVHSRGKKFSTRLENCIKSINWAEKLCKEKSCDLIVYLGDFFDKNILSSEEISALSEIKWSDKKHIFLVGNHEMLLHDLSISSSHIFNLKNSYEIIDKPTKFNLKETEIVCLPYILEKDRKELKDYGCTENSIVFSHNDIKGIQLGRIVSSVGFNKSDISNNSKIFFNGHLHNGTILEKNVINVGNLTGQNFSEDALKYKHKIYIYDTSTEEYNYYENPYAFNFIKFEEQLGTEEEFIDINNKIKEIPNVVFTAKVSAKNKALWEELANISIANRILTLPNIQQTDNKKVVLSVNHIEKFSEYAIRELGNIEEVIEELNYIK